MIGDPHEAMQLRSKLNFYRNKVQLLRRQARHLSSRCASQNETRAQFGRKFAQFGRKFGVRMKLVPINTRAHRGRLMLCPLILYPNSVLLRMERREQSLLLGRNAGKLTVQSHGPFDSECANIYGGPIDPGSVGDRLGPRSSLLLSLADRGDADHEWPPGRSNVSINISGKQAGHGRASVSSIEGEVVPRCCVQCMKLHFS